MKKSAEGQRRSRAKGSTGEKRGGVKEGRREEPRKGREKGGGRGGEEGGREIWGTASGNET